MGWYIIELADGSLTPYADETESGIAYGWGLMPKRKVDLDELLKIAEELEAGYGCRLDEYHSVAQFAENAHEYERGIAYLIRKAVGL